VEAAAADHGKQNYSPLLAPSLFERGASPATGAAVDPGTKHDPAPMHKCLRGSVFYGNYGVSEALGTSFRERNPRFSALLAPIQNLVRNKIN